MIANGIKEITTTTGTGAVALSAAVGFARFSDAFSVSDTVEYAISDGNNWEWGTGTVGAGNTLARTTVHSSLVGGVYTTIGATAINLSGSAAVICTITAEEYLGHQADATAHNIPGSIAAAIGGLGNAAALDVGTITGTVAAGDDARFSGSVTGGDSHDHAGGDGAQIAYSGLSGLPTLGTAAAAATGDFEAAGAVSTHNAVTTAHGISAWGATLVDDADASTARSTLGLGTAATTASTAYATATQGSNADSHAGNTSNPHSVTRSQVGLGSVDNTSDASKPVSTAQQTALNLKADIASPTFTGTVGGITAAMVGAPSGSGTSTGTNTGDSATPAETTTSIGTLLNGATSKTTPVDADQIGLMDSAASNIWKKLSWASLKTALSSVFVTLAGVSQTITGKIGIGVTPAETLSVGGNLNITGDLLYGNPSASAVEMYGVCTDYSGYGSGGLSTLIPGGFDRLMFLDKRVGASLTSSVSPDTGALHNMVDGLGTYARFDSATSPITITLTLETSYSTMRDFSIVFYKNYAPLSFSVAFYDSSDVLLGQDVQAAWPSTRSNYIFKTDLSFYLTKKIIITLTAPKSGYNKYHIFGIFWSYYFYPQFPAYLHRGAGGDVYAGVNVAVSSGSLGVGTTSTSAKIHAISTTEQLRVGYDAANYLRATVNSAGDTTLGTASVASAVTLTAGGYLGIGKLAPTNKLDIYEFNSLPNFGSSSSINLLSYYSGGITTGSNFCIGMSAVPHFRGAQSGVGVIYVRGIQGSAYVDNLASGVILELSGVTFNNYFELPTGSLVSNSYGANLASNYRGAGNITNNFGVYYRGFKNASGTGTITNSYGLYIDTVDISGNITNNYGVYVNDATSRNYFAGRVSIGTATPVASAQLEMSSTTTGFLPPRMTTTQKNAVASPAAGLMVYDTTLNKLCVYTTTWETITSA